MIREQLSGEIIGAAMCLCHVGRSRDIDRFFRSGRKFDSLTSRSPTSLQMREHAIGIETCIEFARNGEHGTPDLHASALSVLSV